MLELSEHPKSVRTMLSHSNIAITLDLYSHVSLKLEKKAAERLNNALVEKTTSTSIKRRKRNEG